MPTVYSNNYHYHNFSDGPKIYLKKMVSTGPWKFLLPLVWLASISKAYCVYISILPMIINMLEYWTCSWYECRYIYPWYHLLYTKYVWLILNVNNFVYIRSWLSLKIKNMRRYSRIFGHNNFVFLLQIKGLSIFLYSKWFLMLSIYPSCLLPLYSWHIRLFHDRMCVLQ